MSSLGLGIILAVSGGALLALAMVTQRYALDPRNQSVPGKVPLFKVQYNSTGVWVFGLILYGGANGLYAMALLYGPLSLLAGCFTTLLVFNLIFARCLLGERITLPKVVGSAVILLGVVASILAAPSDVDTELTPTDIERLASRPVGAIYVCALVASVVGSVVAISWFDKRYPLPIPPPTEGLVATSSLDEMSSNSEAGREHGRGASPSASNESPPSDTSTPTTPPLSAAPPPAWLDRVMSVVYPGSLGLDEGICHLTMKACVSMLDTCGKAGECGRPTMWVFMLVWIGASVATLWWLRRVFTRYETTRALPVEYGAVNAVSACSGLVFYSESSSMKPWQLTTMCAGVAAILAGIAIGNMAPIGGDDSRLPERGDEASKRELECGPPAPWVKHLLNEAGKKTRPGPELETQPAHIKKGGVMQGKGPSLLS